jgi:anti-sigma regulatory factor (Ser/Thr protein kinase)
LATRLFEVAVNHEQDVVTARQRATQLGALLGFDQSEQTCIATAVSEVVRNAFRYTGSGRVEYSLEGETAPQLFAIVVSDKTRSIPVVIVTSARQDQSERARLGLLTAAMISKDALTQAVITDAVRQALGQPIGNG